eukprot:CAMPEP_0115008928 /NCGR_PEP_ID=MMETSP0216-20121206/22262_1 /TAXON_ID=223996 /ORGANISM="Protocruzia adherens, Strain Boccale" /LENGTH=593 /DNA_ID=CAMNT_0002376545 /DNA_START=320 /DNA_END=2101 /DNA_ORIENTATION=-
MFVSSFVLKILLDVIDLNRLQVDDKSLEDTLDALLEFRDRNLDPGVPGYVFWPQKLVDNVWVSTPSNVYHFVGAIESTPEWMLDIAESFGILLRELGSISGSMRIPADTDGSSVNIALGSFLESHRDQYPEMREKWETVNSDYEGYFKALKRYAYRPFINYNSNSEVNQVLYPEADVIDPRTYMYLHEFIELEESKATEKGEDPELILLSTWMINRSEQIPNLYRMPFETNNVDISVNANGLFSFNSFFLSYPKNRTEPIFDREFRKMYKDITGLLEWGIKEDIVSKRPDLSLTYYPSMFNFYWFVARNVQLIQSVESVPYPEMLESHNRLALVMRNEGTQQILGKGQLTNKGSQMYWKEFLGDYAEREWGEDTIFATALAVNSLLDIWTVRIKKSELRWVKKTPLEVKDAITKGMAYLNAKLEEWMPSLSNAFFSGSVKTFETLPWFYPGTISEMKNGRKVDPKEATLRDVSRDLYYSWKGYVSSAEYRDMLDNQTWFGFKTPHSFSSFNQFKASFPYWSSESMTLALSMLSIAKFDSISQAGSAPPFPEGSFEQAAFQNFSVLPKSPCVHESLDTQAQHHQQIHSMCATSG